MKKLIVFALLLFVYKETVIAQSSPPFWQDIIAFKKQDSIKPPPAYPILFIGSSSFTRWTDLHTDFPGYNILNRAFGGSTLVDVIRYAYDIILPYKPKQIVLYCGENDLASKDSIPASEAIKRVKTLFGIIRTNLPAATITYVSMKPSPVRAGIQDKVRLANKEIKAFLRKQKNASFVDVYYAMLDKGQMREELFIDDRLHMKPEGYGIWKKIIQPYLIK